MSGKLSYFPGLLRLYNVTLAPVEYGAPIMLNMLNMLGLSQEALYVVPTRRVCV